jgi:protein TonB
LRLVFCLIRGLAAAFWFFLRVGFFGARVLMSWTSTTWPAGVRNGLKREKGATKKPARKKNPKAAAKPRIKQKTSRKLKRKPRRKPAPPKKHKKVTRKSTLARKKSKPRKQKPKAADKRLAEIKKKLARQREEEKLAAIRQRLKQENSPAAQARRNTLLQEYQQLLKAWLMRNWHLPEHLLNSGLEATISLTIDASGQLISQKEEKLSGNLLFDNAMRQAVAGAEPFPPFPPDLKIPQEEFVITFNPNNLKKPNF